MSHIFLSYSREDTDLMQRVRTTLVEEGFEVWTDEKLQPGTPSWEAEIERRIEAAWCVVVLLTPDSRRSSWVQAEISYAQTHGTTVFPVLAGGDEKQSIPMALINYQLVDIRTRFLAQMQHLVDHLHEYKKTLEAGNEPSNEPMSSPLRRRLQEDFWKALLARSKGKTTLFANTMPRPQYWMNTNAGKKGLSLGYTLSVMNWAAVELHIDAGDKARNKAIFDALHAEKDAIEQDYGGALEWLRLDSKRASRILQRFQGVVLEDQAQWANAQDTLIDAMIRLDGAFRPRLEKIEV